MCSTVAECSKVGFFFSKLDKKHILTFVQKDHTFGSNLSFYHNFGSYELTFAICKKIRKVVLHPTSLYLYGTFNKRTICIRHNRTQSFLSSSSFPLLFKVVFHFHWKSSCAKNQSGKWSIFFQLAFNYERFVGVNVAINFAVNLIDLASQKQWLPDSKKKISGAGSASEEGDISECRSKG